MVRIKLVKATDAEGKALPEKKPKKARAVKNPVGSVMEKDGKKYIKTEKGWTLMKAVILIKPGDVPKKIIKKLKKALATATASHKYVKRTGTSGNFTYWYKDASGKLKAGPSPSGEQGAKTGEDTPGHGLTTKDYGWIARVSKVLRTSIPQHGQMKKQDVLVLKKKLDEGIKKGWKLSSGASLATWSQHLGSLAGKMTKSVSLVLRVLRKAKYIKREGTRGHYKYYYKPGQQGYKHNDLVEYAGNQWRVVSPHHKGGYDLATVMNGKTVLRYNVPHDQIKPVKESPADRAARYDREDAAPKKHEAPSAASRDLDMKQEKGFMSIEQAREELSRVIYDAKRFEKDVDEAIADFIGNNAILNDRWRHSEAASSQVLKQLTARKEKKESFKDEPVVMSSEEGDRGIEEGLKELGIKLDSGHNSKDRISYKGKKVYIDIDRFFDDPTYGKKKIRELGFKVQENKYGDLIVRKQEKKVQKKGGGEVKSVVEWDDIPPKIQKKIAKYGRIAEDEMLPAETRRKAQEIVDKLEKPYSHPEKKYDEADNPKKTFRIDLKKMKENPLPKDLKKKWAREGGVDNPEYQAWIKKHWAQE